MVEKARAVIAARKGLKEAEALVASGDREMAELAEMEIEELRERLPLLEQEMQLLLLPKDVDDKADIVLEVRAGTGGDEDVHPLCPAHGLEGRNRGRFARRCRGL